MTGIVCERWKPYRKYGKHKGYLDLSEAPQAYKSIEDVIDSERDLVTPLVRLTPLAAQGDDPLRAQHSRLSFRIEW